MPAHLKYNIGDTRIHKDGYILIKIAPKKWSLLQRENWKAKYGEYPPKGFVLSFKDNNKFNCDVDNLQLTTYKKLLDKHGFNNTADPETKAITHTINSIKRMIIAREKNGTSCN